MKYNLVNPNFTSEYGANLLKARGVRNVEDYIAPNSTYLNDPEKLDNIDNAVRFYLSKITPDNSKVLLIVDCDVDGYTSATIIYQYTKQVNCHCHIDYLLHDGKAHGLQDHINSILDSDEKYDLIILPDSSSNDFEYHERLKEINTPCLVIDHHLVDIQLSNNAYIVNNQLSPNYPNKDLTGAGVVYQFCRYTDKVLGQNWAENYLDLVAWGVIGDMGSMLDMENRYIAYQGLKNIKNNFLHCLLDKQAYSITGAMGATWDDIIAKTNPISVAFYIVPLVNALIRVGTQEEKDLLFKAFIDGAQLVPCNKRGAKGTMERADVEAARVCTNAKAHQAKAKDNITFSLEERIFKYDLLENKILFIELNDSDDFIPELNGLIATQLSAKYKKPTMIGRKGPDGFIKGSIRGLNNSSLVSFKDFLTESGLFDYVQGHDNAAGFSINSKNIDKFLDYSNNKLKDVDFGENVYDVNFVRPGVASDLSHLIFDLNNYSNVWGQNNPEPLIYITDLYITKNDIRLMGSNQDTTKFERGGISYMRFKDKDFYNQLNEIDGDIRLEVVGRANLNVWCGRYTPQIFIDDYEIKKSSILDF